MCVSNLNTTHGRSPLSQPLSLPPSRPQCSCCLPQGERSSGRGPGQHTHRFDLHRTGCYHTHTHTLSGFSLFHIQSGALPFIHPDCMGQMHPSTVLMKLVFSLDITWLPFEGNTATNDIMDVQHTHKTHTHTKIALSFRHFLCSDHYNHTHINTSGSEGKSKSPNLCLDGQTGILCLCLHFRTLV